MITDTTTYPSAIILNVKYTAPFPRPYHEVAWGQTVATFGCDFCFDPKVCGIIVQATTNQEKVVCSK